MKIKILTVLSLAAFLFLVGCRSASNTNANANHTNTANTIGNTNIAVSTATPYVMPDAQLKSAVEDNLKKKNISGVDVEVKDGVVTLRGNITKDKLPDAMMAASETNPKKVDNQLSVK